MIVLLTMIYLSGTTATCLNCYFSAKHISIRAENKDLLVRS